MSKKMMNREVFSRTERTQDCWETPEYFFKLIEFKLNLKFTLDPAASKENALCDKYYTKEDNGLIQDWSGENVFVNPPYKHISDWVKKCYLESLKPNTIVVLLMPARVDTEYWHDYIMKYAHEVWLCKGRVDFLLPCDKCGKSFRKTTDISDLIKKLKKMGKGDIILPAAKKRFKDKNIRLCQNCFDKISQKEYKIGSSSTLASAIVIFKKTNNPKPVFEGFNHKEYKNEYEKHKNN
jgi:site-specific DNA-methyltransferase (adenine-specific)